MMSRLVPYRSKPPAVVKERIEQTQASTMYLVQTTGPTSYVVQEQNCEQKHKVLIGSLQTCSCGDGDVCVHILFIMLKVLRVPATTPIVWQKSLIDSEIESLLRGDYREKSRPVPKPVGSFLKKKKETGSSHPQTHESQAEVPRHELVEGEVCAICQEDMDTDQPLTYCRKGCGNNFHIECMKVFGESRRQSKENIICPLCRQDWGDLALTALKKEIDEVNRAPNVHRGVACKKCQTAPIRNERYRCIQCKNTDLCDRCFRMNVHINHAFVMKKMATDGWGPAIRMNQRRAALSADLVDDLQNRELTTNDYDLLLQLDQRDKWPLQEYLLSQLGGQKILAANAKTFGDPGALCTICRQSLRIQADVRSVLCGHAFHESCLARSILAQAYVCPYPGCDFVLFPGLHLLNAKAKSGAKEDQAVVQQAKHNALPALEASFSVMPLRQPDLSERRDDSNLKKGKRTAPCRKLTSREEPSVSEQFGELTIGLVVGPCKNALPPLQPRRQGQSLTDLNSGKRAQLCGSRQDGAHSRLFDTNSETTSDRMKHAEQLRSEMLKSEKERLRQQRLQREHRTRQHQHHTNNNDTDHAAVSLPSLAIGNVLSLEDKLERASEIRQSRQKRSKQELASRRHAREELLSQRHETARIPDLIIGITHNKI